MAVIIKKHLQASPAQTGLPSGPIVLRQTLLSDLGGETATVTYSLDGRHNISFQTENGPAKQIRIENVSIPASPGQRSDTVQLVMTGGGTSMSQIEIDQEIKAETTVSDSVAVAIKKKGGA
jgi:hypothetical protein